MLKNRSRATKVKENYYGTVFQSVLTNAVFSISDQNQKWLICNVLVTYLAKFTLHQATWHTKTYVTLKTVVNVQARLCQDNIWTFLLFYITQALITALILFILGLL